MCVDEKTDHIEAVDYFNRAQVSYKLGEWDNALESLKTALAMFQLEENTSKAQAYTLNSMANTYKNKWGGRGEESSFSEAEDCYRQALVLKPEYPEAFINRADLYLKKYKKTKAPEYIEKVLNDLKMFYECRTEIQNVGDNIEFSFGKFVVCFRYLNDEGKLSFSDKKYFRKVEPIVRKAVSKDIIILLMLDSVMVNI